jgi:mycofactocin precursor
VTDSAVLTAEPAAEHDVRALTEAGSDTTLTEELLVEEISIDGMCGVY